MLQFTLYISNEGETATTPFPGSPNVSSRYRIAISEPFVDSTFSVPVPINPRIYGEIRQAPDISQELRRDL